MTCLIPSCPVPILAAGLGLFVAVVPVAAQEPATQVTNVVLEADEVVDAGEPVPVVWLGPDSPGDYIAVAAPDDPGYVALEPTGRGSPLRLTMPAEPGQYELRYVAAAGSEVLARRPIEVLPVSATLYAAPRARAGDALSVDWDGPDYPGDRIAIARAADGGTAASTPTRMGAPLTVTAPHAPGAYELQYVMNTGDTVLAAQPLEVVEVSATLDATETATAGAPVVVTWDGPAYPRDFLSVARADDPGYESFRYVRDGSPLILDMPTEAGTYELRYVAAGVGETVLARRPITLTEVSARIEAPETVPAGENIPVAWEGPNYRRDFVSIAGVAAPDGDTLSFVYVGDDSPALLQAPETPGRYELRYHLGADDRVLARRPITVTE
ncbi:hypothetical protein ROJ8625_01725 [Roseivivax jejudonensis]|uniref:Uncharacterized protein n=1 Tax=Roseivivax jejudonensis TaxID=1529041 RepID=A0A1X6Z208_9RHOB|nr:hypothetical protein [Roseivivax jejudonensis]SLN37662.1 hypothetical protein ROJ8625_01725 [Roseivivax jejudonensis]